MIQPQINADERRCSINSVTEAIIGAAFKVSNALGCGFFEKVYENALAHELRKRHHVQQQHFINVRYENVVVGQFAADLLVDDQILVEIKTVKCIDDTHLAQCLNYLKATGKPVCLLLNFAKPKLEIKRIVSNF